MVINKTHDHRLHLTIDSWTKAMKLSASELEEEGLQKSSQYGIGATLSGVGWLQLRVPGGSVWVFLDDGRVSRVMYEDHVRGWLILRPEEKEEEEQFERMIPNSVDTMRRGEQKI